MSLPSQLLLITFLESFASVLVQRGIYFFSHKHLDFSGALNLSLAVVTGAAYVAGALASHRVSQRIKEKPLLIVSLAGQIICHVALGVWAGPVTIFVLAGISGWFCGLKWPVIESYVSAGLPPAATAKAVGRFNVTWAVSVPLAVAAAGPIIDAWGSGMFLVAAGLNLLNIVLLHPFAASPTHLAQDHPERPGAGEMVRLKALLTSSRCTLPLSYGSIWLLAAVLPGIFEDLGFQPTWATPLASLIDGGRLVAFIVMYRLPWWHGRVSPLVAVVFALPVGFFTILFGGGLPAVLVGELVVGLAAGVTYFAALYYAMVVENAAVEAGGAHEGLIGLGFVVGPLAGLLGAGLTGLLGSYFVGTLVGIGPMFLLGGAGALRPLRKLLRDRVG